MSGHKNFKELSGQIDTNPERRARVKQAEEEIDHYLHEVNRAGHRVALAGLEVRRQRAKAIGIQVGPLEVWWSISRSWWEARAELKDALNEYEELIKDEEK